MLLSVLWASAVVAMAMATGTHIFGIDQDFNKVNVDPDLLQDVEPIVTRLKTFKVAVHPRIRFFYGLLRKGMARHVAAVADSLYVPDKYIVHNDTDTGVGKHEGTDEDYGSEEDNGEEKQEKEEDKKNDEKDAKKDDEQKDVEKEKKDSRKKGHKIQRKVRKGTF